MHTSRLAPPDQLWWAWALLAARGAAAPDVDAGSKAWLRGCLLGVDRPAGSWARLERLARDRAVLWGRDPASHDDALTHGTILRDLLPDWALTESVERALRRGDVGFLAWHARGEWDSATEGFQDGAHALLDEPPHTGTRDAHQPLPAGPRQGGVDPDVLRAWLGPGPDGSAVEAARDVLERSLARPTTLATPSLRRHLHEEVHRQMRAAVERPGRRFQQRPVLVTRWARTTGPDRPFEVLVRADRDRLVVAGGDAAIPRPAEDSLLNVLGEVRREEADEAWGAWLFARVGWDGQRLGLDRAFDHWPGWFPGDALAGPDLDELRWEVDQRDPRWRPAWAVLLPPAR